MDTRCNPLPLSKPREIHAIRVQRRIYLHIQSDPRGHLRFIRRDYRPSRHNQNGREVHG